MPKILIVESCIVNYGDDRGGVAESAGDCPDINRETALALVEAGRALYVDRADDPDRGGRNTASEEMLRAAKALKKSRDKPAADQPAA